MSIVGLVLEVTFWPGVPVFEAGSSARPGAAGTVVSIVRASTELRPLVLLAASTCLAVYWNVCVAFGPIGLVLSVTITVPPVWLRTLATCTLLRKSRTVEPAPTPTTSMTGAVKLVRLSPRAPLSVERSSFNWLGALGRVVSTVIVSVGPAGLGVPLTICCTE